MIRRIILVVAALATSVTAQPVQFSATVRGELGYGTNPFLQRDVTEGAAFGSITVSPRLTQQTARSSTTLDGSYTRYQYFNRFGYTDTLSSGLQRIDQLTEHLTSTFNAGYSTTNRAILSDPELAFVNDPLNIGRRTRTTNASYVLQWQPSAADRFTLGGDFNHVSYGRDRGAIPNARSSSYTQYGGNVGYDHGIDARTSVGVQARLSYVRSAFYPDSRLVQPSLTAKRQLDAHWTADGHVGLVFEKSDGPLGSSSTSVGYGLNLCGEYPRTRLCITGERGRAPSGYGGLRTDTTVTVSLSHTLTEHSRMTVNGTYYRTGIDDATQVPVVGASHALLTSVDYDRDITQRLSAGFGGSYQQRRTRGFGTAHAISGTIHLTAKLGRL